jgi:hypothetical protein
LLCITHVFPHNSEFLKCILTFYYFDYWVCCDNKTPFCSLLTHAHICSSDVWWEWKSFSLLLERPSLPFPPVSCQHTILSTNDISCSRLCGSPSCVHNKCTFTVRWVHPLEPGIVIWPRELARKGTVPWSLPAPWWLHPFVPQSWLLFRPGRLALLSFGQAPSPPSWTA